MVLEFGPFTLDAHERVLRREGKPVSLTPKSFDILLVLVQNSGRVLTKQEIIERVWPDTIVDESNLARQVSTLRKTLGRAAAQYVETIPWRGYHFNAAVRRAQNSLAVLPFLNENGNADADYLADGVTEGLINRLSLVSGLTVMSRNSAMRWKELDVEILLTGRIRFLNDHVMVSAELINTADSLQLWGAQYRRKRSDILGVQEVISNEIVEHLRLKLNANHKRPAADREAYDLYLKGRFFLNKVSLDGVRKALDLFNQSIAKDPDYALAHAGLIDCHMSLNNPIEAKKAAVKALELDPALGEAHASLGFLTFLYEWDWSKAETELRRGIELNPNYAQARQWYALYLAKMGRHDEAVAEAREAQRLDPLSLSMNLTMALVLCFARRYDQSIKEIKRVIEMDANFAAAHSTLGLAYAYRKMCNEAVAAFRKASALAGNSPEMNIHFNTLSAYSYAASGRTKQARSLLNELSKQPGTSPYALGVIHAQLGERSLALDWLERAYRERNYQMVWLKVDPALDPLRRTRRFQDLLTRVGLA
jgi:DNA-binding winged helix-turn-helix (wHTH) protein/Tfp pilus assembly protein PilF